MSKKAIDRFIKDVQILEIKHGVRIGFLTVDDGKKQLYSCNGIEADDPLLPVHLKGLQGTLHKVVDEDD